MTAGFKNNLEQPSPLEVSGIRIPDEEMVEWIKIYHDAGFSDAETSDFMMWLNKTFRDLKDPKFIDKEAERMIKEAQQHGLRVDENLKSRIEEYLESKFEK